MKTIKTPAPLDYVYSIPESYPGNSPIVTVTGEPHEWKPSGKTQLMEDIEDMAEQAQARVDSLLEQWENLNAPIKPRTKIEKFLEDSYMFQKVSDKKVSIPISNTMVRNLISDSLDDLN